MERTVTAGAWVSIPKPHARARVRLFCFPYAGGGTFEFRAWSRILPETVEVCAIQLPGREARLKESPFMQLRSLVEALAGAIIPYLDKPYAFFGHSLGAFIGFELVRQLRRDRCPGPAHLLVSGSRAPQIPNPEPPVYHLPDNELIQEVCRRYDGIPREVLENAEMVGLVLPAMRADFAMSDTYGYADERPLDCPISCFGGLHDRIAPRPHLEAWRDQTRSAFLLKMFAGDHFFIKLERDALLQTVVEHLNLSLQTKQLSAK